MGTQRDPPLERARSHTWGVYSKQGPLMPPWLTSLKLSSNLRFWPFVVNSVYLELGLKCWFSVANHLKLTPCFFSPLLNSIWENGNTLNVCVCLEQLCTFPFETYGSLHIISFPLILICSVQGVQLEWIEQPLKTQAHDGFADNRGQGRPWRKNSWHWEKPVQVSIIEEVTWLGRWLIYLGQLIEKRTLSSYRVS